ncbi:MAG TPA: fumarylacetoacetase [Fimbriimonadaceae bacterium]|nr:fumarylacetoacetase [Fimbriimonadaceae bacterium]
MSFSVPTDARSWLDVAEGSHFPIQNLPLTRGLVQGEARWLSRIGDRFLDLERISLPPADVSPDAWRVVRQALYEMLRADSPAPDAVRQQVRKACLALEEVQLTLPVSPRAFVDFYSGIHHASNVGRMFRPEQAPLLPNYRHVPIGYNGRASTVFVSGTDIKRPRGQQKRGENVVFEPSRELDFELEMGFYIGRTSEGRGIEPDEFTEYAAGMVIVNDWSARDIQRWEYQPLGPFLAKSFATSVSPYIVSFDALEPFRIEGMPQDPEPLPYLQATQPWHYDIELEVSLKTDKMTKPQVICRSNTKHLYWSMAQQLAHQASNGTIIEPGDLYATGTISGPEEGQFGSMLEASWKGEKPLLMEETGETRTFLEDGDTVAMTAWAQGEGYTIGFGEVIGTVHPAG